MIGTGGACNMYMPIYGGLRYTLVLVNHLHRHFMKNLTMKFSRIMVSLLL